MNPKYSAPPEGEMLRCQEAIGYLFRRDGLLRKALTHSSVKDDKHPSNERLEFLGDAILGMVISEYLFSMLPHNDEGDLTKVKSVVVSSQSLSRLGLELGLDKYLLIGKGIRLKKEIPRSLVANSVESVIAAVYLDRGMEAARHFVLDHLHAYVEEVLADEHVEKNYKSLLQQCAQKELSGTPIYRVVAEKGPDHSKSFRVAAVINGREFPIGSGASKKEAEQDAAKIALLAIEKDRGRSRRKPRRETPNDNGRPASRRDREQPRATETKSRVRSERKSKPEERKKPEGRKRSDSRKKPAAREKAETKKKPETRKKPESRKKPEARKKPETRKKPESRKKADSRRKEPERPPLEAEKPAETKKRREPRRKVAPDREPAAKPAARVKGSRKAAKKPAKKASSDRRPARVTRNPDAARKPARTASPSSRKKGGNRRGNR